MPYEEVYFQRLDEDIDSDKISKSKKNYYTLILV